MTWPPEQRRASWVAPLGVVVATALVLVVALWAASAGPDDPFRGEGPLPDPMSTSSLPEPTEEPAGEGPPSDETGTSWLTHVVAGFLGLLALVLLGSVVVALVLARPRLPRWRRSREDVIEPVVADPVAAVAASIAQDAVEQLDLLLAGSPRNGVVRCWHRFEVQAERADVAREPWETSSEFTLRLLDLVEADAGSVRELAGLYREARFSEHELDEADRTRAQEALQRIHRDLRTLLSGGRR